MKYKVLNCPKYYIGLCGNNACKDCTDCLVKQIIKRCKEKTKLLDWTTQEILDMFEIEEVEE